MKNFSKILILILAVAALFTVMAIAVAATEEESTLEPKLMYTSSTCNYWEGKQPGEQAGEKSVVETDGVPANYGLITTHAADNGNLYAVWTTKSTKGNNNFRDAYGFPSDKSGNTYVYNIADYPTIVMNYDTMTPTGYFGNVIPFNMRMYSMETGKEVSVGFLLAFSSLDIPGLDTTPHNWQHVSVAIDLDITNADDTGLITAVTANVHFYVNGIKTGTNIMDITGLAGKDAKALGFKCVRFGCQKLSSANANASVAVDNVSFSYFPEAYGDTAKAVETVLANDVELPYGITKAAIGDVKYDDIDEAIAAAKPGEIVALYDNVYEAIIEKSVIIDTNKYDEDGNATGEYYDFTFVSSDYLPNGENGKGENGVISFNAAQNASVVIYWDDCPGLAAETDCTCEGLYAEHLMALETKAILYSVPKYNGDIPEFEVIDKKTYKFLGWSYTQGGEVEELRPITAEDVDGDGYLSLYPVYEELNYTITVIAPNGFETDYLDKDWYAAFASAPADATIRLNGDTYVNETISFSKNLTLDLNGYSLIRISNKISNYKAVLNNETGEYVAGDLIDSTTVGTSDYFFKFTSKGFTFNVKSSRPGAQVINAGSNVTNLYLEDELVSTVTSPRGGGFVSLYPSLSTFNIYGDGITFYVTCLFYGEHGSNNANLVVNIDGGTYIRNTAATEGMLSLRRGGTHTVKNAKFYINDGYFNRGIYDKSTQIILENCEIYDAIFTLAYNSESQIFNNCKLSGRMSASSAGTYIAGNGTVAGLGNNLLATAEGVTEYLANFAVPTEIYTGVLYSEDFSAPIGLATETREIRYTALYSKADESAKIVPVDWLDSTGKLLATTPALKGYKTFAPDSAVETIDHAYLNVKINNWLNADGSEADLMIGDAARYVFKASADQGENPELVAGIKDARLSLSYYSQFMMRFYLPVVEGMERPVISAADGFANTVLIDGEEFWLYTFYSSTATVANAKQINVVYTIDAVEYTQSYAISALVYADIVLADPSSDAEALTVANMVRYIKEARIIAGLDTTACDALLAKAELPEYATEYPNADVNIGDVAKYVEYFNLKIAGGTPSFAFKISEAGVAAGVSVESISIVTASGVELEIYTYDNGVTYQTNNVKVYNANELLNVTITIPAAEEGAEPTVVTGQYSLGAYIKGVEAQGQNADLAKALHAFAVAAKAYRDSRTDY